MSIHKNNSRRSFDALSASIVRASLAAFALAASPATARAADISDKLPTISYAQVAGSKIEI